ncbi:MAG: hypothetical protein ABW321_31420 [Polyangiales bacterium]
MNMHHTQVKLSLAAWLLPWLTGCIFDVDDDDFGNDGLLTVHWSIEGSRVAARCTQHDVRYAYVTVESRNGREDELEVPCDRFWVELELPPGRYWARVVLRDRSHEDRTETLKSSQTQLYRDDSVRVSVDFGADAFL